MLTEAQDPGPESGMPLLAAADLQDHLLVASNDLDRLQRLLGDACDSLMAHFQGASGELRTLLDAAGTEAPPLQAAMQHMAGAITAMQFQDMASQLVAHTTRRLRNCADRLAADAFADDGADDRVQPGTVAASGQHSDAHGFSCSTRGLVRPRDPNDAR